MTEEYDYEEPVMTRREALKGGSAAAVAVGASMYSDALIQAASAQSTEPRIALGSDWEFQDDPNGSGHLAVEHTPNSNVYTFQDDGVLSLPTVDATNNIIWEEDANSPITVSNAQSGSITLNGTYDVVKVVVVDGDSGGFVHGRVNGDSGSNYNYVDVSGNQTNSDTEWGLLYDNGSPGAVFYISGRWTDRCGFVGAQNGSSTTMAFGGNNSNVTSPLDSIELRNTVNMNTTAHVFGVNY